MFPNFIIKDGKFLDPKIESILSDIQDASLLRSPDEACFIAAQDFGPEGRVIKGLLKRKR
jgi:hypothetical protein